MQAPITGSTFSNLQDLSGTNVDQIQNPFPSGQKAFPSGEEEQKLTDYALVLAERAQKMIESGCATNSLYEFLDDPKKYLVVVDSVSTETFLLPYLNECACTNSDKFNRFSNSRRADIENLLTTDAAANYPKEKPLRYLSVGVGGCLQDFINIGKLIKAGFQHIEAVLIDPSFHSNYNTSTYKLNPNWVQEHETRKNGIMKQMAFLSAVAKELDIKLEMSFVDNVSKAEGFFQVVQLVDFDDFESSFSDVMISHSLLAPEGRFYLSFDDYDLVFDTTRCVYKNIHHSLHEEAYQKIKDLLETLNISDLSRPHVAMLTLQERRVQWMQILPKICQADTVQELALTILRPKKISFFGYPEEKPNKEFTTENLSRFFTLLTGKPVTVNFCETQEKFLNGLSIKPDIVTYLFNAGQEVDIDSQITRIRTCYSNSRLFFSLSSYKNSEECVMDSVWSWDSNSGSTFYGTPSEMSRQKVDQLMK